MEILQPDSIIAGEHGSTDEENFTESDWIELKALFYKIVQSFAVFPENKVLMQEESELVEQSIMEGIVDPRASEFVREYYQPEI